MIESICGSEFPKKVIPLIDRAQKNLRIVVFDWRWYPNEPANPVSLFNQSIIRAHRRGVEVQVIANTDDALKILRDLGIVAKRPATPKMIHAKMMIIDDDIVIIGSHNYTYNAFTMNHEISAIIRQGTNDAGFINFYNNLSKIYG
jgi:phosphatidylserine/phosphatidylglycerophosphate/cardiolipin synthase-like enzyme